MTAGGSRAEGSQAEFEPGSRGRVLRNRLGVTRVREMQRAESEAMLAVQEWAYAPLERCFSRVLERTSRACAGGGGQGRPPARGTV